MQTGKEEWLNQFIQERKSLVKGNEVEWEAHV